MRAMTAVGLTSPAKEKLLAERMSALGVREEDLEEQFVRSSGAGGQKVNKTSSCVLLHHRPTGIRIKCQQERSQAINRYIARLLLLEKLAARRDQAEADAAAATLTMFLAKNSNGGTFNAPSIKR